MNNTKPLISLITLNYNQIKVTCEFLESTKLLTYPNYEIILVDNASSENPTELIKKDYPHVKLIVNDKNLGFTGGNNIGMKAAKGDYLFIVNNDTEVTSDLLEKMVEAFEIDESIGVVSPKIMDFYEKDVIQYAGYSEINPYTGRGKNKVGLKIIDKGQHDTPKYTDYAHGAAMLVRKEVIDKVGMLPDHFFIYYEELDWSSHIRRAGYKIYYYPQAVIYHKESMTMGKESAIKAYYHNRNRILFMRRNASSFQFLVFFFFLIFTIIPKNTFKYLINKQFTHLRMFYKGLLWNVTHSKYNKQ